MPERMSLYCASSATGAELPKPNTSTRRALFNCSMTCSITSEWTSWRKVSSALAVLPKTLLVICSTESCCAIAENCTVDSRLSEPDSLSLKSCKPSQPTLRQKRITVGWLTLASEAIVLIELLTNHCGWCSTQSATRASERDKCVRALRMRANHSPSLCSSMICFTLIATLIILRANCAHLAPPKHLPQVAPMCLRYRVWGRCFAPPMY